MKKFFVPVLISTACFLFVSCKSLPLIEQGQPDKQHPYTFLKSKYQVTHSIKAELPNNNKALLIGLTSIDPSLKSMHAVLMTVEGLVLFDVIYKDNIPRIDRAVPPFDSPDFSGGLLDDLKLIFFTPDGKIIESGILKNIGYVERYRSDDGTTTDVIAVKKGIAKINKYDYRNTLTRTAKIISATSEGVPREIELIAHGFLGYSLYLELINAERIK